MKKKYQKKAEDWLMDIIPKFLENYPNKKGHFMINQIATTMVMAFAKYLDGKLEIKPMRINLKDTLKDGTKSNAGKGFIN